MFVITLNVNCLFTLNSILKNTFWCKRYFTYRLHTDISQNDINNNYIPVLSLNEFYTNYINPDTFVISVNSSIEFFGFWEKALFKAIKKYNISESIIVPSLVNWKDHAQKSLFQDSAPGLWEDIPSEARSFVSNKKLYPSDPYPKNVEIEKRLSIANRVYKSTIAPCSVFDDTIFMCKYKNMTKKHKLPIYAVKSCLVNNFEGNNICE